MMLNSSTSRTILTGRCYLPVAVQVVFDPFEAEPGAGRIGPAKKKKKRIKKATVNYQSHLCLHLQNPASVQHRWGIARFQVIVGTAFLRILAHAVRLLGTEHFSVL